MLHFLATPAFWKYHLLLVRGPGDLLLVCLSKFLLIPAVDFCFGKLTETRLVEVSCYHFCRSLDIVKCALMWKSNNNVIINAAGGDDLDLMIPLLFFFENGSYNLNFLISGKKFGAY